jgi:hypothetical protein
MSIICAEISTADPKEQAIGAKCRVFVLEYTALIID